MPRGRNLLIIAVLALIVLTAYLLVRQGDGLKLLRKKQVELPVNLQTIIPTSWKLLDYQSEPCDFDGDGEDEWLLLYRYDSTSLKDIYHAGNKSVTRGPIGGVVYDAQVNLVPQDPGNVSPYRPALLVPYKLLPDYYAGKGQGFLGETAAELHRYMPTAGATGCIAKELTFLGYSDAPLPTRLSIFRWVDRQTGYEGVHFIGNARVLAPDTLDTAKPITAVTTYNHLLSHRSLLCEVRRFDRPDTSRLDFVEDSSQFTIDFCYQPPNDPAYPEAVLVALLRGANPQKQGAMVGPTGASFLTKNARVHGQLTGLDKESRKPIRILSVTNQGGVEISPEGGANCSTDQASTPEGGPWWCEREETEVKAEIVLNSQIYVATARLISIANEKVAASVYWRVTSIDLQLQ